ncbi:MAG: sn-glycerol-3-phosphate ABC transporter ATP-binding protein UgpC [Sphingomonas sp.]
MANVRLARASKSFGDVDVLKEVDLDIEDGEFVVFVGPSGCGKSTLLRVIAGLEMLSGGQVLIDGRVVNHVPPAERGIAMVFQSYALYPHMSVRDNLGFALKLQNLPRAEIAQAVFHAAQILDITHLLDRKPRQLSGGQRQRVAIGRAIVRKPKVFLFDEPLSNLDAALRVRMRYEFAGLHKSLGATMIYVTHDQVEAMTLADRIVVLCAGRVEQVGTPTELYERPDTLFVAGFIGSPGMNFLPAVVLQQDEAGLVVKLAGGTEIHVAARGRPLEPGAAVTLGIRPEHFAPARVEEANTISATVRFVESLGNTHFAYLDLPGVVEPVVWAATGGAKAGGAVRLAMPPDKLYLFDAAGRAVGGASVLPRRDAA